jgi:hypothetical protein
MRTFNFQVTITCAGPGEANLPRVEELVDLYMQDLIFDDNFIAELDETEAVTIETKLVK